MTETTFGIWDGITESKLLGKRNTRQRLEVFEAAKSKQWIKMLDLIEHLPRVTLDEPHNTRWISKLGFQIIFGTSKLTQVVEPESALHNTLLHYAAFHNADIEIINQLIEQGACCSRYNAQGQTALDVAREQGHTQLYELLKPQLKRPFPLTVLRQIDHHFYDAMMSTWAQHYLSRFSPQYPQVSVLLETQDTSMYFTMYEMCGGFDYWFDNKETEPVLYAFSDVCFSNASDLHKVTSDGYELFAEDDKAYDYSLDGRFSTQARPWDLDEDTFLAEDLE